MRASMRAAFGLWPLGLLGHGLYIDPCDPLHGVLAPALSVGVMGHLGHLANKFKSLAYNITTVYIYSILITS
jgi:hypothetical protein